MSEALPSVAAEPPLTAHASRSKALIKFVLSASVLVGLLYALTGWEPSKGYGPLFWIFTIGSSAVAYAVSGTRDFEGSNRFLRLDEEGFHDSRSSSVPIPWSAIRKLTLSAGRVTNWLDIVVDDVSAWGLQNPMPGPSDMPTSTRTIRLGLYDWDRPFDVLLETFFTLVVRFRGGHRENYNWTA